MSDFNPVNFRVESFLKEKLTKAEEKGYARGLKDGESTKNGVQRYLMGVKEGRVESLIKAFEILHSYAMETKDTKTLDLIESAQKEILEVKY
jgi:hypothetical protein